MKRLREGSGGVRDTGQAYVTPNRTRPPFLKGAGRNNNGGHVFMRGLPCIGQHIKKAIKYTDGNGICIQIHKRYNTVRRILKSTIEYN